MNINFDEIKADMIGQWQGFLSTAGVTETYNHKRHYPCPNCGGKDRFRFTDCIERNGDGGHICSQCGSGDGVSLYMKITGCTYKEAMNDCARFLNVIPLEQKIQAKKRNSFKLPMYGRPIDKIEDILKNEKDLDLIVLTDLNRIPVNIAIYKDNEFRAYKKNFIYGSCVISGEIENNTILVTEYHKFLLLKERKINCIYVYDAYNVFFIGKELKDNNITFFVVCEDDESVHQCDQLGFEWVYYQSLKNKIDVRSHCEMVAQYNKKFK